MPQDVISKGFLQREDGLCIAKGVTLSMNGGAEQGPGDVRATLAVHDDPMFARRNLRKRFVFVSSFDRDHQVEIFVIDANGACIAFPLKKSSG